MKKWKTEDNQVAELLSLEIPINMEKEEMDDDTAEETDDDDVEEVTPETELEAAPNSEGEEGRGSAGDGTGDANMLVKDKDI
ncbi:hypothetical protein EB796_014256 [Bugula neritina]|uniref:Uncharacterized protein n=1 Tax=Bugula neritina TaxID=10212 RepID=A0A7J7JNH5_BUGNE|nr:hypothetical protein EB796_014256 [Bugula neritina]